jgi:hypothetical protein
VVVGGEGKAAELKAAKLKAAKQQIGMKRGRT